MNIRKQSLSTGLTFGLLLLCGTASAQTVAWLRAEAFNKLVSDGSGAGGNGTTSIPVWGYRQCNADFSACPGALMVPGPTITMAPGDTTLTIHLQNRLPLNLINVTNATSLVIPGLHKALSPVRFTDGEGRERIRSFDTEAPRQPASSVVTYEWNGVPPGTYLYHSGTHPQVQVQMGLYGAVVKNAAADQPYPGVTASDELLVFSEIDPAIHAAVTNDVYGTPAGPTSTEYYAPRFFLINGQAYRPNLAPIDIGDAGSVLLRLVNAGIESHSPQLLNGRFDVIAEDGHLAPVVRSQHSTLLPAGKTIDVLFTPTADGAYTLFDRQLRLVNDGSAGGGMFARLSTTGGPGATPAAVDDLFCIRTASGDGFCNFEGGTGTLTNVSINTGPPGVLGNDTSPGGFPKRVTPGSVSALVGGPAGATLTVNTGTGGNAGAVNFNAQVATNPANAAWLGEASFTYTMTENVAGGLTTAPATGRIIRDMRTTSTVFHNPAGTIDDRWNLAGQLRAIPADGNVRISFVQNLNNLNCTNVGEGIDGGAAATLVSTGGTTSWTYQGFLTNANRGGCNRIRIEASMPAIGAVPAHETRIDTNIQATNVILVP